MSDHFAEIAAAYQGDDAELRLMIEQRAALVELQATPAWQTYRDVVYSRIAGIHGRMHRGRYPSLEEYRQDVGLAQGLEQAVDGTVIEMERAIAARLPDPFDEDDVDSPDLYAGSLPAEGVE